MTATEGPEWPELDPQLRDWMAEARRAPDGAPVEVMREFMRRTNGIAFSRMRSSLLAPSVRDEEVDGPAGPIPVRIFHPAPGDGPQPVIVYYHGGGWVMGDLDTHTGQANRLCVQAGAIVVSVGYRLAPEDRFPAAFDDCVAAAEWTSANAVALGGDPGRLAVAGDSAGGQLAASVAIARRDGGQPLAGQLLNYPTTDMTGLYQDEQTNSRYPSRSAHALGPGLTLGAMTYFTTSYVDPVDAGDWRASPATADLHGVAPAVVHTAGLDLLSAEGRQYAAALRAAGVTVITREFPSLNHGYFALTAVSEAADRAGTQAAADLREVLGLPPLPGS